MPPRRLNAAWAEFIALHDTHGALDAVRGRFFALGGGWGHEVAMSRRRRVVALSAAAVAAIGIVTLMSAVSPAPGAPASAGSSAASGQEEAVAKLVIIEPSASIRREGKDEYKPAKDSTNLRVGTRSRPTTPGSSRSGTRTIVHASRCQHDVHDPHSRMTRGIGRSTGAWSLVGLEPHVRAHRERVVRRRGCPRNGCSGGGVFPFACNGAGHCTLTSGSRRAVLHDDGDLISSPLQQCQATLIERTNTDVCDVPSQVTKDEFLANEWLMKTTTWITPWPRPPEFPDGDITITGTIEVKGVQVSR